MRILYISAGNPAVDTILGGMNAETLSGLPAFYYPFKILLDRGHTIDLLLVTAEERKLVESEHFKAENLIQLPITKSVLPGTVQFALQLHSATRRLLKERHYDFVYGMSEGAHIAVREAQKQGIPCGLRQFGTQEMANVLEAIGNPMLRKMKALKEYTYITLSMQSRKSFLLATNDGSRTDQLYGMLGIKKKKFPFFFWTSGVYVPEEQPAVDYEDRGAYPRTYDPLAISMIGRIAPVKRQDRAAKILRELHRRGYPFHLFFVGTRDNLVICQNIMDMARQDGISEYIHFEGGKSQKECQEYARNSFVTLLPCEWNRLNIFYEIMGEGAVVVTNDNHSIDDFIEPDRNCLLYDEDDFGQAAEKIISLVNEPAKVKAIRANAYKTARNKFMTLDRRFGMEVQLVEDAAMGRDLNKYPETM